MVANWVDEFKTWLPSKADQDYKASHLRPHKVFMVSSMLLQQHPYAFTALFVGTAHESALMLH